ncbi:MAG: hypothetical protein V3V78_01560 [Candidatus Woesearchaeota archaeon]
MEPKKLSEILRSIAEGNNIKDFCLIVYKFIDDSFDLGKIDYRLIYEDFHPVSTIEKELGQVERMRYNADYENAFDDYYAGIGSKVLLNDGLEEHLLLVDFKVPCSDENLKEVQNFIKENKLNPGFILLSGRSYHFYSNYAYSMDEWCSKMNEIKDHPIVDSRWANIQLERELAVLRTSSGYHKPKEPELIKIIQ